MNIKQILSLSMQVLLRALKFFRETLSLPHVKLYALISLFLTLIFVVFTFPYEILLRKELSKLESRDNTLISTIYLGNIELHLFSETYLSNAFIGLKSGSRITMKDIVYDSITPSTFLFPSRQKADVKISGMKIDSGGVQIECNITSNMDITIDGVTGYPEKGSVNIMIESAAIKIDQVTLPPQAGGGVITPPQIRFSSVKIDSAIASRKIEIKKNSIFSGSDLKGRITGTISLEKIFNNSIVNLKIEIDPQSGLLAKYKELLTGFVKDDTITLIVKGTLANPVFEVQK